MDMKAFWLVDNHEVVVEMEDVEFDSHDSKQ
jgi:hypothetical protein